MGIGSSLRRRYRKPAEKNEASEPSVDDRNVHVAATESRQIFDACRLGDSGVDDVGPAVAHVASGRGQSSGNTTTGPATLSAAHSDGAVGQLADKLSNRYKRALMNVDAAMLGSGRTPSVADIHVNLVILSRQDLLSEFAGHSFATHADMMRVEHTFCSAVNTYDVIDLKGLFKDVPKEILQSGATFRVIAVASAGCGKTTIFTKVIPLRWATEGLWRDEFDLVVAREFRFADVRQAKNVRELLGLESSGVSSVADCLSVEKFLFACPQRVCVILDGVDEASLTSCSEFMQKVIHGELLQGLRLVITGRPCPDIYSICSLSSLDRRIEVIGFRPCDIEPYVRRVLSDDSARMLVQHIHSNSHLRSMMATPLLAYEICRLYHFRCKVPECVSDLFEMLLLQVAEKQASEKYSSWDDINDDVRASILQLGQFAFEMLERQQAVFSASDLRRGKISNGSLSLGLLVSDDDYACGGGVHQFKFSHLTLQENLAAKFKAVDRSQTPNDIVQMVATLGAKSGHLRTFWILLAAQLSHACLESLVHSLMVNMRGTQKQRHDNAASALLLAGPNTLSLKFPMNFIDPLGALLSHRALGTLAEVLLGNYVTGSAERHVWDVVHRSCPVNAGSIDFLKELLLEWSSLVKGANADILLSAVHLVDAGASLKCRETLDMQPSQCVTANTEFLPNVNFEASVEDQQQRLLAFQCFSEHALKNRHNVQALPSIAASLTHRTGTLRIRGDSNPAERRAIGVTVKHHCDAVRTVFFSDFERGTSQDLPLSIADCSKLEEIRLQRCSEQIDLIALAMQASLVSLERFTAVQCPLNDKDVLSLGKALRKCHRLTDLDVTDTSLSASSVKVLAKSVSHLDKLKTCSISANPRIGDNAMASVCHNLSKCSSLRSLFASRCSLTGKSLTAISMAITHWPELRQLVLKHNDFDNVTTAQADAFITTVNHHGSLQKLSLCVCHCHNSEAALRLVSARSYREGLCLTIHFD